MRNKLKRLVAIIMTAVFLLPSGTWYAGAEDERKGVEIGFEFPSSYASMTDSEALLCHIFFPIYFLVLLPLPIYLHSYPLTYRCL